MKNRILSLLVVFSSCRPAASVEGCNYITDFYQHIYLAELDYQKGNLEGAFDNYTKALQHCEPINMLMYYEVNNYAEIAALTGRSDLAFAFMKKKLEFGSDLSSVESNEAFDEILSSDIGKDLMSDYGSIRSNYLSTVNMELRNEIQQMMHSDQYYRSEGDASKRDSVDSAHTERLIEIFEEFGYPNERVIGRYSLDQTHTDVGAMLLHTNDSIRLNYFIPKLKEFVAKGTCPPTILGNIIDQYHLYNGDPQTHGTYRGSDSPYADMIADRSQVNKNRIEIGLPTLELQEQIDSLRRVKYGF